MQRYEMDAWLGDHHGLDEDQIDELIDTAAGLADQHEDDSQCMEAELIVAYRLMVEIPEEVVRELGAELLAARVAESRAKAGLQRAALRLIRENGRGVHSEAGFARTAGIDRMTVRGWRKK